MHIFQRCARFAHVWSHRVPSIAPTLRATDSRCHMVQRYSVFVCDMQNVHSVEESCDVTCACAVKPHFQRCAPQMIALLAFALDNSAVPFMFIVPVVC